MMLLHQYGPDSWNDAMLSLAPPTSFVFLAKTWCAYLEYLYSQSQGMTRDIPITEATYQTFVSTVERMLKPMVAVFPKLGPAGITPVRPVDNARDCIRLIGSTSECHRVMRLARDTEMLPVIALRKWIPINPASEFRIFIRRSEIAGICQYDMNGVYPELADMQFAIMDLVASWFKSQLRDAIEEYLPDVNVDVICVPQTGSVTLLDINPANDADNDKLFGAGELLRTSMDFRFIKAIRR